MLRRQVAQHWCSQQSLQTAFNGKQTHTQCSSIRLGALPSVSHPLLSNETERDERERDEFLGGTGDEDRRPPTLCFSLFLPCIYTHTRMCMDIYVCVECSRSVN